MMQFPVLMNLKTGYIAGYNYDDFPENPRTDTNLPTILTWQSRYNSPDTNPYKSLADFIDRYFERTGLFNRLYSRHDHFVDFCTDLTNYADRHNVLLIPLSMHDHSSIRYELGLHTDWDTRMVGFIFATKSACCTWFNATKFTAAIKEQTLAEFTSELAILNDYVNGEVYCLSCSNGVDDADYPDLSGVYAPTAADLKKQLIEYFELNPTDWVDFDQKRYDQYFRIQTRLVHLKAI